MLDGKQVGALLIMVTLFFAIPAAAHTFLTHNTTEIRTEAYDLDSSSPTDGFVEEITVSLNNPEYFFLIAFIAFVAFSLLIILFTQRRHKRNDETK